MNVIDKWLLSVRRRDSKSAELIHDFAKALLEYEPPNTHATRSLYGVASRMVDAYYATREVTTSKLLWTPMLRARCEYAGKSLYCTNPPSIKSHARIRIGDHCTFSSFRVISGRFHDEPELTIGDYADFAFEGLFVVNKRITIGSHVQIAPRVVIADSDGHPLDLERRMQNAALNDSEMAPVTIGDHVWIGRGAQIMKGVTIGRGSVVGAGSVVVTDVPEGAIAMGNPARALKR